MSRLPIFRFTYSQWLKQPPDEAFLFFERPENLSLVTPDDLGFHLITPSPVTMREGAIIDYTIHPYWLRIRWRTLITQYQPPTSFVDEQLSGPYSYWHHLHQFAPENGGTRMLDTVNYALPNALPNKVAHAINRHIIRPRLKRIFSYRAQRIPDLLDTHETLLASDY